jgi:uncharacterized ion transporter superfamily protein YfcC
MESQQKAGAQISSKAFIQSLVILFVLMIGAGILTRVIPVGAYDRVLQDGREMIQTGTYHTTMAPDYPIWRWFTAPVEVLFGPDNVTILTIIVFLLMVGISFAVLDQSGILTTAIARLVRRFGGNKYLLLLVISFFFMLLGAFFGIFEEVVPLVPVMVALSYTLGWDTLVGLGMSILATNMGFSAAVTNPFTVGVAQRLAGLPTFSGALFRILIFLAVYAVLAFFLVSYARKVEKTPEASLVYDEDRSGRLRYGHISFDESNSGQLGRAALWLMIFLVLILAVLVASPFVSIISSISLPLVGLLFCIGGIGAGLLSNPKRGQVWKAVKEGFIGIVPAIPLILMAASVKHIVAQGGILDTLLNYASGSISKVSPFSAVVLVYAIALIIELFVSSGSAKAILIMPILLPLADLIGVTRQLTVIAYCFGDGFSNLAYPTNPVLLICLGLTVVSYPKWLKWTAPLWLMIIAITLVFLAIGVGIHIGPF